MSTVILSKPPITEGIKTAGVVGLSAFAIIAAILVVTGKPGTHPETGGGCPAGTAGCCKKCAPNVGGIAAISILLGVLVFFLVWLFAQRKNIVARAV